MGAFFSLGNNLTRRQKNHCQLWSARNDQVSLTFEQPDPVPFWPSWAIQGRRWKYPFRVIRLDLLESKTIAHDPRPVDRGKYRFDQDGMTIESESGANLGAIMTTILELKSRSQHRHDTDHTKGEQNLAFGQMFQFSRANKVLSIVSTSEDYLYRYLED